VDFIARRDASSTDFAVVIRGYLYSAADRPRCTSIIFTIHPRELLNWSHTCSKKDCKQEMRILSRARMRRRKAQGYIHWKKMSAQYFRGDFTKSWSLRGGDHLMPTTRIYHRHQHWQTAGEGLSTGAAFRPLAKRQAGRKDSVGDRGGHHPRLYLLASIQI
jgi:hypothetical protein